MVPRRWKLRRSDNVRTGGALLLALLAGCSSPNGLLAPVADHHTDAGAARSLPANLRGITYDDISAGCAATPQQIATAKRLSRPTIRVVFDRVAASCYRSATSALDGVAFTMGELVDSSAMKAYTLAQIRTRASSYVAALGSTVDLWEIGNEVNGEWVSSVRCPGSGECDARARDVIAKVEAMYRAVSQRGYRTALTLYYQPPKTVTRGYDMISWEERYVPASMRAGLDYVFISYYETDNAGIRPAPSRWDALFRRLAIDFPNARVGFGEIGMDKPIDAASLSKARSIFGYYQGLEFGDVPRYTRAGFWWNAAEDLVPAARWPSFFNEVRLGL
jgi:hypothetical protein